MKHNAYLAARVVAALTLLGITPYAAANMFRYPVTNEFGVANGESTQGTANFDGRYIAFISSARGHISNDTNGKPDVFVRDMNMGMERINLTSTGAQSTTHTYVDHPAISGDGRFVAFATNAKLTPNAPATGGVFVRDRIAFTTTLVSLDNNGQASPQGDRTRNAVISANGRWVAFESADVLAAGDNNTTTDIYVRDLHSNTTVLASARINSNGNDHGAYNAAISADGRYVAFASDSTNFVANDTNQGRDVFLRDLWTNTTQMISIGVNNDPSKGGFAEMPSVTARGRYVSFHSNSGKIVAGDTNNTWDVFVRDTQTNTTRLASRTGDNSTGNQVGNGESMKSWLSATGRFLVFESKASNFTNWATPPIRRHVYQVDTAGRPWNMSHKTFNSTGDRIETSFDSESPFMAANGLDNFFQSAAQFGNALGDNSKLKNDLNGVKDIVRVRVGQTTVSVSFACNATNTAVAPSETVYVVGSVDRLGDWVPAYATPLNFVGPSSFSRTISVPINQDIEWKCIKRANADKFWNNITWQAGANNTFRSSANQSVNANF